MTFQIPQDFLKNLTTEYGVSDAEFEALSLALKDEPTVAIAAQLEISEVAIRKRLGEVYKKFNISGVRPGKIAELKQLLLSEYRARQTSISKGYQDLGEAPDGNFYGRSQEITKLKEWIWQNKCRLVAILGMGGIGKTTLSVQIAKQLAEKFEYVIWRSLRHAPSLEELSANLIQSFSNQQQTDLPDDSNAKISRLIECLQAHRCLIVLDDFETLLQTGELAGYYREGYEEYRELLKRVAQVEHQSCLVLTSSEEPAELALLEGKKVKTLKPMDSESIAKDIFKEKGLSANAEQWQILVNRYRDNLLAFKIVSNTIKDFFNGNVSRFLEATALFVEDTIGYVLEQQFERLSEPEEELMYWLAIEQKPISLFQLRERMLMKISLSELVANLESLERRSLIEKTIEGEERLFYVQPLIAKYITDQFIKQASEEIRQAIATKRLDNLQLLKLYNLSVSLSLPNHTSNKNKQTSDILQKLKNNLQAIFLRTSGSQEILDTLCKISQELENKSFIKIGYAKDNIAHLILELRKS
ncbi:NB-ARC domain-containing protein [Aerosakkonemataceae cyanobacterium BLCC-F50]|uniref:NB-ARC domain-containing protein n=1 Tax=Floridaenema flaviceps BLCC-F50 TaxID=3153642 RepID=A0ABV4XIT0_9CYAN